jgi:membrane protein YqaA with SNARE-associated domain
MNRLSAALYGLRERIESFARHPLALPVLFLIAMIEASLLPIPPDVLFVALAVSRPRSSFLFATVCIAGSVTGAMLGYFIGARMFDLLGEPIIGVVGSGDRFDAVLRMYRDNPWTTLIAAGFTSIPFAVFTIAAGFRRTLDPGTLFLGALAGRVVRFYLLGLLLYLFGPVVKQWIERYLPSISFVMLCLFIVTVVLLR